MIDERHHVERVLSGFAPAEDAFERLVHRRERKRRNQRLAAGAVGIAIALAAAITGAQLLRSEAVPADEVPLAPIARNGDIAFGTYAGSGHGLRSIDVGAGAEEVLVPCVDVCDDIAGADWSPHGTRLAYFESSYEAPAVDGIYVLDVQTRRTTRLTRCRDRCNLQNDLDWSPDGTKIAFDVNERSGRDRIIVMDADGSHPVTLSTGAVELASHPSWSPDGTRIAFSGVRRGTSGDAVSGIYTVNPDGSDLTVLTEEPGQSGPASPAWSPDGAQIAFFVNPRTNDGFASQLWMMSADGTDETLISDFCCVDFWGPVWSPDGRKLAFVMQPAADEAWSLYVMNPDGSDLTRITEAYGRPAWRPLVPREDGA
jgi:Tol biopolymer transport system component